MKPDYTTIRQAHPWQKPFNLAVLISICLIAYYTGQATRNIESMRYEQGLRDTRIQQETTQLGKAFVYLHRQTTNLEDRATLNTVVTLNEIQRLSAKPENWTRVYTNDHWVVIYQP